MIQDGSWISTSDAGPWVPSHRGPGALAIASLTPYSVLFYERDQPSRRITALLGEAPPTPSTSGPDWNVVPLPKRGAVTTWEGRANLLSMDVPIIIGDPNGSPISPARNVLSQMWRPADPTVEPPIVKIRAPGDAVPFQSLAFVIATIAWGDAAGDQRANRTMQKLTVTLQEFREDETLQTQKAQKPKHRGKTYTVRSGDTLTSIAKRFNVKGGWRALGNAQHPPIHDPRKIKIGQRLLIP